MFIWYFAKNIFRSSRIIKQDKFSKEHHLPNKYTHGITVYTLILCFLHIVGVSGQDEPMDTGQFADAEMEPDH